MKKIVFIWLIFYVNIGICQNEDSVEIDNDIFTEVEEPASFPQGIEGFYQFLARNLKYPSQAQRAGIQGRVFVQFIVEKDGSITDIKIAKGIGGGCDEEAIRVIKLMPNWIPARQKGQPVRQIMVKNILFKLNGPSKNQSDGYGPGLDEPVTSTGSNQPIDLGLLVIDLEKYYYMESRDPKLLEYAQPKHGLKKFIPDYVMSIVGHPKYFPTSISTSIRFTVFEDGSLGNFMLGKELNKNDTLFVEALLKQGNWTPSQSGNQNSFKLELRSADKIPNKDAHFDGGAGAFNTYLKNNLKFPSTSQRLYADGHVVVEFFVEINGSISNAKVIKGIGEAYDKEALRVIKAMPKWIPQTKNGFPLRQRVERRVIYEVNLKQKTIKN